MREPRQRPAPPLGGTRPRWKPPWILATLALLIIVAVAAALQPGARGRFEAWRGEMIAMLDRIAPPAPERGPASVAAEAFTPLTEARTGPDGANVRDYPLPSGDLIVHLPARTPLNISARLNVQGNWWFRVTLDDGRMGFVHEDVVRFARAARQTQAFEVEPLAMQAIAGPAGARVRAGPGLDARQIVRVPRATPLAVTGRLRQGAHWWLRVETPDGRTGFARDDVLTTPEGEPLTLS